jgi:hypothetical protein
MVNYERQLSACLITVKHLLYVSRHKCPSTLMICWHLLISGRGTRTLRELHITWHPSHSPVSGHIIALFSLQWLRYCCLLSSVAILLLSSVATLLLSALFSGHTIALFSLQWPRYCCLLSSVAILLLSSVATLLLSALFSGHIITVRSLDPFQSRDAIWHHTFNSVLHMLQFWGAGKV